MSKPYRTGIPSQGFNLPPIRVGDLMKLKGERSRVDGRKALVVEIVGIIGGHNDTESRSAGDRFIAQDGPRQFYGVARSQLSRVTKSA